MPPGGRGRRPIGSVSSHPRPARSAPSEWPLSARSGIRPGPPGGTGRSWRRPTLRVTPCSVPLELWRVFPGPHQSSAVSRPGPRGVQTAGRPGQGPSWLDGYQETGSGRVKRRRRGGVKMLGYTRNRVQFML